MSLPKLIVIAGPTAVGKTTIAIKLAKHFNCEIISADSRQFYRETEIGTAKPSAEELKQAPHHFVNNLSITDDYNVGKYEKEALNLLEQVFKRNDTAILVGGSGLFINAVCNGFDSLPEGDDKLREKYEVFLREKGIEFLQKELKEKDPVYYETVDQKNPRRLIRALEVIELTGVPYSQLRTKKTVKRSFLVIKIGINLDKEELVERINKRIDEMLTAGWLEECKKLYSYKSFNALKTVGYTELFDFIDGKMDWESTVQQIKTNTWHYAKRQLTWFKKDKDFKWFLPGEEDKILKHIATFVAS